LIEEEEEPFTMNTLYYMEYRSKFLAYYKDARLKAKSDLIRNMESKDMRQAIDDALCSLCALTRLGLGAVDASLLANLVLPEDRMEQALEIMASVRAYFQGS
jgi:hypothetical protein